MSKESKMEPLKKPWILELVVVAVMTAILAALVGLWGWTANKVVQNGESIIEVRVEIGAVKEELQQEIGEVRVELQQEIAAVNEKIVANGEKIAEVRVEIGAVKAELGKEIAANGEKIAEVKAELGEKIAANGEKIAAVDAKLDLLIRGLKIAVAPKDKAGAGPPAGAKRGGLRVGAGRETATE